MLSLVLIMLTALHIGFRAPRIKETTSANDVDFLLIETSIPTVSNKQLFAWWLPIDGATESIIMLHGWGGNAEQMLPVALPFQQAGLNVLLIDARNHGKSDSDSFSSLPRFAEDTGKAIDWLKQTYPGSSKKIALLGHSVGAGAVLFEASKRKDLQAIISISAFAHPEWMMLRYIQFLHLPSFVDQAILRYVEWIIGHRFSSIAPLFTVCDINCPVLLVHGKDDKLVPIEDARAIISHCPKPHVELLEIENAGHESVDKIRQQGRKLIDFLHQNGFDCNSHV